MKQLTEVVIVSVAQEKAKHATGMTIASAGVVKGGDHSLGFLPEWLPLGDVAVIVGIIVGVLTMVKTYNEIKLTRIKIKESQK